MEGIAAVGTTASIVQLAAAAGKLWNRLKEYHHIANEAPETLRQLLIEVPLLNATIQRLERSSMEELDSDTKLAIDSAVNACKLEIDRLDVLICKIMLESHDSRSTRSRKAILSLFRDTRINDTVSRIRKYLQALVHATVDLKPFKDARMNRMRKWLTRLDAPDPSRYYSQARKQIHAGTCQWILSLQQYKSWKHNPNSILWSSGIPGCGKSVLTTKIIDDIRGDIIGDPEKVLAYFYFVFNEHRLQDAYDMIKSLVIQLSSRCVSQPAELNPIIQSCAKGSQPPPHDMLLDILHIFAKSLPQVYIIVDALDECTNLEDLSGIFQSIQDWGIDSVHIIATSRRDAEIEDTMSRLTHHEDRIRFESMPIDKDIKTYIRHCVANCKWKDDSEVRNLIEDALCGKAQGMFRWAACQVQILNKCRTYQDVRNKLRDLPQTLDETYDRILDSISQEDFRYALQILLWISFARTPLTLENVSEVAAIDQHRVPTYAYEERLVVPKDAIEICGPLVTLIPIKNIGYDFDLWQQEADLEPDYAQAGWHCWASWYREKESDEGELHSVDESGEIDPSKWLVIHSHFSVKEYLVSSRNPRELMVNFHFSGRKSYEIIVKSCIGLLLQQYTDQAPPSMLTHAFAHWYEYSLSTDFDSPRMANTIGRLFSPENQSLDLWKQLRGEIDEIPNNLSGAIELWSLYCASRLGFSTVVKALLKSGHHDLDAACGPLGTPLGAAASGRHLKVMQILLPTGKSTELCSQALERAVRAKQPGAAALLIQYGADIKPAVDWAMVNSEQTRLRTLVQLGDLTLSDLLDDYGYFTEKTPSIVYYASISQHIGAVDNLECLLDGGCGKYVNTKGSNGLTPIHEVAQLRANSLAVMETLLRYGADPFAVDATGNSILHAIANNKYIPDLQMVEDCGSYNGLSLDLSNKRNKFGRTAWHLLACNHRTDPEYFSRAGLDVNAADCDGHTLLHFAAMSGGFSTIERLLLEGAIVDIRNRKDATALLYLCQRSSHAIYALDGWGFDSPQPPYFPSWEPRFMEGMINESVSLLCRKGANANIADYAGNTPYMLWRVAAAAKRSRLFFSTRRT